MSLDPCQTINAALLHKAEAAFWARRDRSVSSSVQNHADARWTTQRWRGTTPRTRLTKRTPERSALRSRYAKLTRGDAHESEWDGPGVRR